MANPNFPNNPGYNLYVGARYVPLFANPIEWDGSKTYEPLTVVTHQGNSYTSKTFVPANIQITDTTYWALTGNYNAQIEQYRSEVTEVKNKLDNIFIVNVMDYGFDNTGANDNKPLMTDLIADGCRGFYFPEGTYGFTDFSFENVYIYGERATISSFSDNNNDFAAFVNSYIYGIEFYGKPGYYKGVLTVTNCDVNKCKVSNSMSNGIVVNGGTIIDCEVTKALNGILVNDSNVTVRDCYIHDNTAHGIMVNGKYINNINIESCEIDSNGNSGVHTAFADPSNGTVGSSYVQVRGCNIKNSGTHGIEFRSNFFVIDGNVLSSNGAGANTQGIVVQSGFGCISNNEVGYQKGMGIDLGNAHRVAVSGNNVHDCYAGGIEVNYCNDVTVIGNVITGNWSQPNELENRAGILVHNGKTESYWEGLNQNITIVGNTVAPGTNQNYQLYINADSKQVVAVGNMLKSDLNTAVLNESSGGLVDNNLV